MNYKPGDLAITASHIRTEEIGMIVECVEAVLGGVYVAPDGKTWSVPLTGAWLVKNVGMSFKTIKGPSIFAVYRDTSLRPIRGDEGEDETLAWAGKPIRHVVNEAFDEARKGAA